MTFPTDLYDFPSAHAGRRVFVSVRGHKRSIPKYKTYKGTDGYNYILPEYGGDMSGFGNVSTYIMPDKQPYVSPMDGSYITSRSSHREHMKRHNVVEAGDIPVGYFKDVNRDKHAPVSGSDVVRAIHELGGQ